MTWHLTLPSEQSRRHQLIRYGFLLESFHLPRFPLRPREQIQDWFLSTVHVCPHCAQGCCMWLKAPKVGPRPLVWGASRHPISLGVGCTTNDDGRRTDGRPPTRAFPYATAFLGYLETRHFRCWEFFSLHHSLPPARCEALDAKRPSTFSLQAIPAEHPLTFSLPSLSPFAFSLQ